eukprot:235153-Chlamydomonas_euryale.AAC.1
MRVRSCGTLVCGESGARGCIGCGVWGVHMCLVEDGQVHDVFFLAGSQCLDGHQAGACSGARPYPMATTLELVLGLGPIRWPPGWS